MSIMSPPDELSSRTPSPSLSLILDSYPGDRRNLIPILQDLQVADGYVMREAVDAVAAYLNLSPHDVFGVATFFSQFRFHPPGKHCLKVCQGTACHVRASALLLDQISRRLHINPGETTADRQFSLERVMCVGSCALAPVIVTDDVVRGRMTQKKLEKLLRLSHEGTSDVARETKTAGEV